MSLVVANEYDAESRVLLVSRWSVPDTANVDTITTRWVYDLAGRQIVEIAPDSTPASWTDNPRDSSFYDLAGNIVRVRTRRFTESLAASPADSGAAYVRMEYDALNRLTRRIFPAVRYEPRYDGMVSRLAYGMGLNPYPYHGNDGFALRIPADTATFVYHPLSGLQGQADNANALVRRRYYPNGQLQYDSLYTRTVQGQDFNSHKYGLEYRYDRSGRTQELRHPAQLRPSLGAGQGLLGNRYAYDRVTGALLEVSDPLGNSFRYHYNVRGEPDSLVLPGGITHLYTFDAGGDLTRHRIRNQTSGGSRYPSTWLRDESLTYDLAGKLVAARNQFGLRDTLKISYSGLGQLTASTHRYWGWYTDTNQDASYTAGETPVHDALGNIVSVNRTGAVEVYDTGLLEAGHARRNFTTGNLRYQRSTGRLMRVESNEYEFTHYDAGGNTIFVTSSPEQEAGELLDRASFYDGGGRLWAVDVRRVENAASRSPQYFTFEEYRLDALGRRILVRARKHCERVEIDERICSLSSVRRTVWAGDQELYEIQMPEDQAENDTDEVTGESLYDNGFDPNLFWGRVAYTYGGGIDRPLSIVRMGYVDRSYQHGLFRWEDFAIVPHWNAQGRAQSGTFHDGSRRRCRAGYVDWCVQLEWADGLFPYNPSSRALEHWHGTLLTDKRDASGLLYRRNRYYDPGTGRFTQEDPIGLAGGLNVYGFANGDPVSYSDPYGLAAEECCLGLAYDGINPRRILENAEWNEQLTGRDRIALGTMGAFAALGGVAILRGATVGLSLAALRAEYVSKVGALAGVGRALLERGVSPEQVARTLHGARRALGVQYKGMTPLPQRLVIYARNWRRYGDRLGPSIEYLREQGKSWADIIASASRTGGADLGL